MPLLPPGKEPFLNQVLEGVNTELPARGQEGSDHGIGGLDFPGLEAFRAGVGSGCLEVHPLQLWQKRGREHSGGRAEVVRRR